MTPQTTPAAEKQSVIMRKVQTEIMFPADGEYVVFVDFQPTGGEKVTLALPVDVGSVKTKAADLKPSSTFTQINGSLSVTLKYDGVLTADQPSVINFEIIDAQGNLISADVRDMSGSYCKLYAIDEDLKNFLRSDVVVTGDNLQFPVNFPESGQYKVWFEYVYAGRAQNLEFVVDVK